MGTQKMFICMLTGNHITTHFTFLQIPRAVSKMQVNIGKWNSSVTAIDNSAKHADISKVNQSRVKYKDP